MRKYALEIYEDSLDGLRWRVRAITNGKVIGVSSESYRRVGDVLTMVRELFGPKIMNQTIELKFIGAKVEKNGRSWMSKEWPEYAAAEQGSGGVSA